MTSNLNRFIDFGTYPTGAFCSKADKIQYWKKSNAKRYRIPVKNKLDVPSDSVTNEYYVYSLIYSRADPVQ